MSSTTSGTGKPPSLWLSLSQAAKMVYWIGPPITVFATLMASPRTAATLPAIAIPTIIAIQRYRKTSSQKRADFEKCFWAYLFALPGLTASLIGQVALGYGFLYLFHGRDTMAFLRETAKRTKSVPAEVVAARAAAAWSWRLVVQRAWLCYVVAGLQEETLKLIPVLYIRRKHSPRQGNEQNLAYIRYAFASGLGFSTLESLAGAAGLVYAGSSWSKIALELGERIFQGTLGHSLMTVLATIRLLKSDAVLRKRGSQARSSRKEVWWRIMGPSILWHGSFNFALLSLSAMNGSLGWEHPKDAKSLITMYGIAIGMLGLLVMHVWREWKELTGQDGKVD